MSTDSPEGAVTLAGDGDVAVAIVSDVSGIPMVTLTRHAERIIRYDDGTVTIDGADERLVCPPDGKITSQHGDGRTETRPSSKLFLEAAERQGLTITEGGAR